MKIRLALFLLLVTGMTALSETLTATFTLIQDEKDQSKATSTKVVAGGLTTVTNTVTNNASVTFAFTWTAGGAIFTGQVAGKGGTTSQTWDTTGNVAASTDGAIKFTHPQFADQTYTAQRFVAVPGECSSAVEVVLLEPKQRTATTTCVGQAICQPADVIPVADGYTVNEFFSWVVEDVGLTSVYRENGKDRFSAECFLFDLTGDGDFASIAALENQSPAKIRVQFCNGSEIILDSGQTQYVPIDFVGLATKEVAHTYYVTFFHGQKDKAYTVPITGHLWLKCLAE